MDVPVVREVENSLSVRGLLVRFRRHNTTVYAVNGIDIDLHEGETLGVVGESGSGKSASNLAVIRLLPKPAGRVEGGTILFAGRDLLQASQKEIQAIRGKDIAMVFQDPMTSLNPVLRIEEQIVETIQAHREVSRNLARKQAIELLGMVGIPQPEERIKSYPHEFSGGMRQRVMIAMALALQPKILIADEPTTALDVTIQAQILELLKSLTSRSGTSVILITHDLGVVAEMTQRINVMYAGEIIETAATEELFARPSHPYTIGLFHSLPTADRSSTLVPIEGAPPDLKTAPIGCPFAPRCAWRLERCLNERPRLMSVDKILPVKGSSSPSTHQIACHNPPSDQEVLVGHPHANGDRLLKSSRKLDEASTPSDIESLAQARPANLNEAMLTPGTKAEILKITDLAVHFPVHKGIIFDHHVSDVKAVDGVSFAIRRRETLGLVGESGSGKSTIAKAIVRLVKPTAGMIAFDGRDITHLREAELKMVRRRMQMIFQDPYASLDPRMSVASIIAEPLKAYGIGSSAERFDKIADLLAQVGLDQSLAQRYPHEFSGGQRQRIGIARALALSPDLIVADEPVSSLDVSIQAQIINLLEHLQEKLSLTYLLIAHDLSVVERMSHRVAVMYLGRIAEIAPSRSLRRRPLHPYTVALLSATLVPRAHNQTGSSRITLSGEIPSPLSPSSGCRFRTRCWLRQKLNDPEICANLDPALSQAGMDHSVACHFFDRVDGSSEQKTVTSMWANRSFGPQVGDQRAH
jgi:peptide/nickel transport system ATP-binding protein